MLARAAHRSFRRALSASANKLVAVEKSGGYATLRLTAPPVNVLNLALIEETTAAIKQLEGEVGGIILAGNPKIFSAGLDLAELHQPDEARLGAYWGAFERLWEALYTTPLVTVGAAEGSAPAGGCVLMISCDYRVMGDNPKLRMGLNETAVGMTPPAWLLALARDTVGARAAQRLLQSGAMLSPQECLAVGYLDEVVEAGAVEERAAAVMRQWLKVPLDGPWPPQFACARPTVCICIC